MQRERLLPLIFVAALAGACTVTPPQNEITGNNTGGVIPAGLLKGKDAQSLASGHCTKYGSNARITFSQAEAGGEVVFVCESAPPPAQMPPPASTKAPATKQAPAAKQAPTVR